MSSSETPTQTMLCASWATVEANAPRCSPKPRTKPDADLPGGVVALDDGDLGEVARRVGDDGAVAHRRLGSSAFVISCSG